LPRRFRGEIDAWRENLNIWKHDCPGKKTKSFQISFHDIVDRCSDQLQVSFTTYDDAAIWNYTSGSTGVPKAAVHLQHDVLPVLKVMPKAS